MVIVKCSGSLSLDSKATSVIVCDRSNVRGNLNIDLYCKQVY